MVDYAIKYMVGTYIKKQEYLTYYVVGDGFFFGIEVKDPGGKASAIQLVQGTRIKKAGGHFILAKSLQDVVSYIENNKNEEIRRLIL